MTKKRKESKKKGNDWQKTLSRAFIVVILFACVIGFTLSFSFFSIFKSAEAGDYVIVDYTLSYDEGYPIISSDQYVVEEAYNSGIPTAYTSQMVVQAGSVQTDKIIPVDVYLYPEGDTQYALLDLEVDAISSEVEGMHENDVKKIDLEFASTLIQNMTAGEFESAGGNFSEVMVGMVMPLGFSYNDGTTESDNSTIMLNRPAVIVDKTDDMISLKYGYSVAEIKVDTIK